ncbi:MAG: tRNA adenosine(34) deaminase TadA [Kofleriaceae bacterium]|jgi:tRNA(adenine34) deaminase|nr:tRNA adenosine(34) deaminase TadA [Kofleriaceae bacterium]MBP6838549.1 tRNA adenosine(34) deaminase TadA [Kofleriaceae bacterium]MBP9203555.1 tRNA adenosine(34) deaminase TadA [Kofleriaceae bacterium]
MSEHPHDETWMLVALGEAQAAAAAGDVPVGAAIVVGDHLLAVGRNRREVDRDPTAHAEVVALRAAAQALGQWRVEGTLYVTQEPCPMCAGAIVNARVRRLVYGCPNPKAGAVASLFQLVSDDRLNHRVEVTAGVLAEQAAAGLRAFFAELRRGPAFGKGEGGDGGSGRSDPG